MKAWSVASLVVIVLSLLSWLVIYHVDGTPPTTGITVIIVGLWLVIVGAVRLLRG